MHRYDNFINNFRKYFPFYFVVADSYSLFLSYVLSEHRCAAWSQREIPAPEMPEALTFCSVMSAKWSGYLWNRSSCLDTDGSISSLGVPFPWSQALPHAHVAISTPPLLVRSFPTISLWHEPSASTAAPTISSQPKLLQTGYESLCPHFVHLIPDLLCTFSIR